ncbi:glycosyltransferase [Desulfovibrio sp. OttesenSCG-928-F20]|nr:glycosyltransferase [Desulfovibrio sp. OttesenSCG-928-M16]MDL2290538.1 glycosyltransferase [Desulfovibrio sp. OttesenSCG-928-F20]
MRKVSLTVLMTVYNGMPYLKESVRSVLEQDDADFTFLVLNNGSVDGSGEFLDKTAAQRKGCEPRMMVRHLPENIGRSRVLALGLDLVDSDITAIIDADDLAEKGRIGRQRDFFDARPDIDLLGSDIIYIDTHGAEAGREHFPEDHDSLRDRLPLFNQFAHSACAFRTAPARAAGGYDPSFPYAQDLALWVAMITRGSRVASLAESLARIRVHPGQATRDLALLMVRASDNHRLAEAMLQMPGLSAASTQAAYVRSALALWRLGEKKQSLGRIWKAFALRPSLFFRNPMLWQRAAMEWHRRVKPTRYGTR